VCAGHAFDGDDDDIRVFLAVLAVVGAEQDWVCFFAESPAGASSFLGGRQRFIAAHRSRVLHSQPASQTDRQPPLACLPCPACCCSRAAADTRSFQAILPLITRPPPTTPLSFVDDCHASLQHLTQYSPPTIHLYPSSITSKPIHTRYSLRLLAARTALCRPRSLALHIAPPIHIPASASRIHDPRGAPYSANSACSLDHCLRRRLPTRRHVQLYW
jgi:hypothetical protein